MVKGGITMIKYESFCNGCTSIGLPCTHCEYGRRQAVVYCDSCSEQIDWKVYNVNGSHYCEKCLLEMFYEKEACDYE